MSSSTTALQLLDLIQSHRITSVIYVAAKLGIADLLSAGPKSVSELANATGANQAALARLLTALATIGLCTRSDDDTYHLTDTGAVLSGTANTSFKAWAIFEGEMLARSWSGMLETITTGSTAAQLLGFNTSFDVMARSPENVSIFNAAMADLTRLVTIDILASYDFSRVLHLMDVGGGSGELIGSVVKQNPHIRGTVFDLERCAPAAGAHLAEIGVDDRASFLAGDFFQSVPSGADAIVLKSVIHDWDDQLSCVILQNCCRALPKVGVLLLIERIMPQRPIACDEHRSHAFSDLNMLRGPGGKERTEEQYRDLLGRAGFGVTSIRGAGRFAIIEASPS
jgi:DNA-binding HxlR family transcriptional regulator